MAKAKKKLLPKDFDALLKKRDLGQLKAVFDVCDVNARGGYGKQTAELAVKWVLQNPKLMRLDPPGYNR